VAAPDPSERTMEQIQREIRSSREAIDATFSGKLESVATRMGGMDKAVELLQIIFDRVPDAIKVEVSGLERLISEKLNSIANQFTLRDVAVAAALKAAQEAVFAQQVANDRANTKMETAFEKRIDGIEKLIVQVRDSLTDKVETRFQSNETRFAALEYRITSSESTKRGGDETRERSFGSTNVIIGWVFGAIGVLGMVATLVLRIH
jgi:hypothetical protein